MRDKQTALITGISGQDGYYLTKLLTKFNYTVIGTTRKGRRYSKNDVRNNIKTVETDYSLENLGQIVNEFTPSMIFNLAGQSFVSKSWELLSETIMSQGQIVGNFLDVLSSCNHEIKFINATSAEIFDHSTSMPFSEQSEKNPYNPYGCAQLLGYQLVKVYREKLGLWAANSILFPHESRMRTPDFMFPRVIAGVKNIHNGLQTTLEIGNLETERDWGYAPEYMNGMFLQSQHPVPEDFCFCTGQKYTVREIIKQAFAYYNLNMEDYVVINKNYVRNYEPSESYGNPTKAWNLINWKATSGGLSVVDKLMRGSDALEN